MNQDVLNWLMQHPQWVLRSEFIKGITDYELSRKAISNSKRAFLTQDGKFYESLRELPNFIGVKQIMLIESIFTQDDLVKLREDIQLCNDVNALLEMRRSKEIAISKAQEIIQVYDEKLLELGFDNKKVVRINR